MRARAHTHTHARARAHARTHMAHVGVCVLAASQCMLALPPCLNEQQQHDHAQSFNASAAHHCCAPLCTGNTMAAPHLQSEKAYVRSL